MPLSGEAEGEHQGCPDLMTLRAAPKLFIRSCGWSEVQRFIDHLDHGLVIDISEVVRVVEDGDRITHWRRWECFGGEGGMLDAQLRQHAVLRDLVGILQNLCARYFEGLRQAYTLSDFYIVVICDIGKHHSRWVVSMLDTWLSQLQPENDSWYQVKHLSDENRRRELTHYRDLKSTGWSHMDALSSVKSLGLRRRRWEFDTIRWELFHKMQRTGYGHYWVDLRDYPPSKELVDWLMYCLPAAPLAGRTFETVCEFRGQDIVIRLLELSGNEYCHLTVPATQSIAAFETQCIVALGVTTDPIVLPNGDLLRHAVLRNPRGTLQEIFYSSKRRRTR